MFRNILAAFTAIGLATLGAGQASAQSFDCAGGAITIGMAKAQTGGFAFFDNVDARGALIAIEQINEKGGIGGCPIKVIRGDTQSDPAKARQVAEELIAQGAQLLIVPADFDIGVGASQAAQAAGILSFSCAASSTAWTQAVGPHHFTAAITIEDSGKAQAVFANQKGWKRMYVVVNAAFNFFTALEKTFRDNFAGEIVATDTVANDATDYSANVSKIRRLGDKVDAVYLNDYFPHVGTFIRQLRAAGVTLPILGNSTFSSKALPKVVGAKALSNVYYIAQGFYEGRNLDPAVADLVKRYEKKYGTFPENLNVLPGYQGMLLLADALRKAGSVDAAKISAALSSQTNVALPGSTLYRWKNRHPVRSATVIGFDAKGEFVKVQSVDPR
ncbi:MAG: ABC transporter substrate-binding protein [Rhodospirillaceae bacterium]|nr:ABC transporter substrate-binding protein [Rhodospirillaceae bacterium]